MRCSLFTPTAALAAAFLLTNAATPVHAVPDASPPAILGIGVGAEAGVAGKNVSSQGIPYYLYAQGGLAHLFSLKGELLGGGGRTTMTNVALQYNVLPLPVVNVVAEPGVTNAGSTTGPSIGLRASASPPLAKFKVTAYARAHFLSGRTTTEVGAGADYPIASLVRGSISVMQFNGGFEPNGTLFLIGIKARLGH